MKKIVVTVPVGDADTLRRAMGEAGAGKIGNYTYCSFSVLGTGRFLPGEGAHPAIGKVGDLETVDEERIEVSCDDALVERVVAAIRAAHPYEEPVIDLYDFTSA
jgi:hypothetical protein